MARGITALTFEQRGSAVPFDHKPFADTRVRERKADGGRELDALILGYAGTRRHEVTVMPWHKLQSLSFMNDRDTDLQISIYQTSNISQLDPINIREMALKADAIFGADEERRDQALKIVERDKKDAETVRLSCIAELTRECGIAKGDQLMMRTNTRTLLALMSDETSRSQFDLEGLVDRVMTFAAERSGTTVDDAKNYLEPLVALMTPLGNIAAKGETKANGFLYNSYVDLVNFRKEINDLKSQEIRPELLTPINDTISAADDCIAYVAGRMDLLNRMMGHLATMFDENSSLIPRLNRVRRDVAYGLDGWDILIPRFRRAFEARGESRDAQDAFEEVVFKVGAAAPHIPRKERDPSYEIVDQGKRAEMARVKMIREMHNWSNDLEDAELKARVELGRARQLVPATVWTDGDPTTESGGAG